MRLVTHIYDREGGEKVEAYLSQLHTAPTYLLICKRNDGSDTDVDVGIKGFSGKVEGTNQAN